MCFIWVRAKERCASVLVLHQLVKDKKTFVNGTLVSKNGTRKLLTCIQNAGRYIGSNNYTGAARVHK
jgi:hypothetical protein